MKNNEPVAQKNQEKEEPQSVLEQILREGARKLLQTAIVSVNHLALIFNNWHARKIDKIINLTCLQSQSKITEREAVVLTETAIIVLKLFCDPRIVL